MADLKKLVLLCALTVLALTGASFAQQSLGPVTTDNSIQNDVSPAVSDLPTVAGAPTDVIGGEDGKEGPDNPYPLLADPNAPAGPGAPVQTANLPLAQAVAGLNFAGMGAGAAGAGRFAPPDTNGAVGNGQYVQAVNVAFAVYNKSTGALISGPVAIKSLWSGFGGTCETRNDGDPIVQFDKIANRWIISQFSVGGTPFLQCIAVSTTPNAAGTYNRYAFSYGNNFIDYPKLGTWPDAYYATYNAFNAAGTSFLGAKICALNRSAMLVGAAASQICFGNNGGSYSILPADFDGTVLPPAGSQEIMLEGDATANSSSVVHYFKIHVDFVTPANTTGTVQNVAVPAYTQPCIGFSRGACVPQPPSTPAPGSSLLESLNFHMMHRLVWRMAGGREELLATATVVAGARSGIRWYESQNPHAASPTFFQAATYAPDAKWRWMPSIAMDKMGNIAVGYSVSDAVSTYPSIAMSGRLRSELRNVLEPETMLWNGTGAQTFFFRSTAPTTPVPLQRWGDYSEMTIDPADDCTFYFTTEYIPSNGTFNWETRIATFKFPNCN